MAFFASRSILVPIYPPHSPFLRLLTPPALHSLSIPRLVLNLLPLPPPRLELPHTTLHLPALPYLALNSPALPRPAITCPTHLALNFPAPNLPCTYLLYVVLNLLPLPRLVLNYLTLPCTYLLYPTLP